MLAVGSSHSSACSGDSEVASQPTPSLFVAAAWCGAGQGGDGVRQKAG